MPKKHRAGEGANGGAGATPPHPCAHCGACDKHDRCDHCGYCRKCGVYVMLPQVPAPIFYNGGSGCVDSGNTLIFFTAQALSSGASQIGPS